MVFKSKGVVLSLVLLAVLLPVSLQALSLGNISFNARADSNSRLRMWIEPSTVTIKQGQKYEFKVMAAYEDTENIVPGINMTINSDPGVILNNRQIKFTESLNGRKIVGSIEVIADKIGKSKVWIEKESVGTGLPSLDVEVTPAEITVRN